jgi:DNA-binding PadR family transcriptional regulator
MSPLSAIDVHILLSLADGERHGYGIMREVSASTGGKVVAGPGVLYGAICRMLAVGLIEESGERSDPKLNNEPRRYYRLTSQGLRAAKMNRLAWTEAPLLPHPA